MKNTLRVNFSSAIEEFEILSSEDCSIIKGGVNDSYTYALDSDGFLYRSIDSGDTWERISPIGEVVIPPPPSQGPIGNGQSLNSLWSSGGISNDYFSAPPSSGGGSSGGGYDPAAAKFQQMLYAVNLSSSLFEDTLRISEQIAKLGDFAEDAKILLINLGKHAGNVGKGIDIANALNDLYQDGVTPEGLANLFSSATGFAIGYTPLVGGILGFIYDEVAEEWLRELIKQKIIDFFGEGQGGNPGMPQGPGN